MLTWQYRAVATDALRCPICSGPGCPGRADRALCTAELSRLERLESSADALAGRCGVFDGEVTCGSPLGHGTPHRFYDPSGSGRWIAKDDWGREVDRGGGWADESPAATLGGLLGPRPRVPTPFDADQPAITAPRGGIRYGQSAALRPASCGDIGPAMLRPEPSGILPLAGGPLCMLPVGHDGMHRADDGVEWRHAELRPLPAERSARMRTGRRLGRTLYLMVGELPSEEDVVIGMVDTPELAAEVCRRWNGA